MEDQTGLQFLQATQYANTPPSAQKMGLPQPPLELETPPNLTIFDLPAPASLQPPKMELRQAIEQRQTRRDYAQTALSLEELAYLLWCTQGVKSVTERPATLRTVPSAGARHAFETWLLVNRVQGLEAGLYRYQAITHKLIHMLASQDICEKVTQACLSQKQVRESAVTFLWVAVVERMTWRYPARGFRYLFLDAGHVCQNLYLAAEQIGCGVCAIAAYDDDLVNQAIQVDGKNLFTIYLASLGKVAKNI